MSLRYGSDLGRSRLVIIVMHLNTTGFQKNYNVMNLIQQVGFETLFESFLAAMFGCLPDFPPKAFFETSSLQFKGHINYHRLVQIDLRQKETK